MAIISKRSSRFNKEDVRLMDDMLKRFYELKGKSGVPDYSPNYVAYIPVLALALLWSQNRVERLTWVLIGLTVLLAFLTGISLFQVFR
jgi:hypothetical protein